MSDKSILITGCSTGIGYHCALSLRSAGYRVFATARQQEDVDKLIALGLEAHLLDLDDSESIRAAFNWVMTNTGGTLYALFNNGAYGQPGAVEDLSRDTLRQQFETNLFGWMELTNLVIPVMREQGYGRIIQNSSVLGLITMKYRGAYNASKFAIEGLTDTLRLELHGSGIYVSLVEPGPIESKFRENALQKFRDNIDTEQSYHRDVYHKVLSRLSQPSDKREKDPFTLGPEAVCKKVIHALESERPKARYYVTFPTYLFGYLKRLLPNFVLDFILRKVSDSENR